MIAVIHDTDPDGLLSAALVQHHVHLDDPDEEVAFFPFMSWQRNDKTVIGQIFEELEAFAPSEVFMVDCSMNAHDMDLLARKYNFKWIDHHSSSAHMAGEYMGLFDENHAACQLTWQFFNKRGRKPPEIIGLVGDYDIYRNQHSEYFADRVIPFHMIASRLKTVPSFLKLFYATQSSTTTMMEILDVGRIFWEEERMLRSANPFKEVCINGHILIVEPAIEGLRAGLSAWMLRGTFGPAAALVWQRKTERGYSYAFRSLNGVNVKEFSAPLGLDIHGHDAAAGAFSTEDVFV